MPSLVYQKDGSVIVTDDNGQQTIVPHGSQDVMDLSINSFLGDQTQAPLDPIAALAALLIKQGVITAKQVQDETPISVSNIAEVITP